MRRQNRWGRSVPVATSAESGRLRKAARGERRPGRLRRGLRAGKRREGAAVPLPSGTAWEGAGGDLDGGGEPRAERRRNASGTAGGQGWGRGKGQPLQPHTARGDRTRRARTDSRRSPDTAARGENGAAVRGSPRAPPESPPSSSNRWRPGPAAPTPQRAATTRTTPALTGAAPRCLHLRRRPRPRDVTRTAPAPSATPTPCRPRPPAQRRGERPAAALQWAGRAGAE